MWKLAAQLPMWVRLCASARYAFSRRNSCVSNSCSVTSIVVPTNPLKTPCCKAAPAIRRSFASSDYDLSSSWLDQGLIVPASCAALTFAQ